MCSKRNLSNMDQFKGIRKKVPNEKIDLCERKNFNGERTTTKKKKEKEGNCRNYKQTKWKQIK